MYLCDLIPDMDCDHCPFERMECFSESKEWIMNELDELKENILHVYEELEKRK